MMLFLIITKKGNNRPVESLSLTVSMSVMGRCRCVLHSQIFADSFEESTYQLWAVVSEKVCQSLELNISMVKD